MDSDYGTAPAETGAAYLAMLSIDSLLNVVAALEKLTDIAVDGVVVTPDASAGTSMLLTDTYRHRGFAMLFEMYRLFLAYVAIMEGHLITLLHEMHRV